METSLRAEWVTLCKQSLLHFTLSLTLQLQNRKVCLLTAETFQEWGRNLAFYACRASEAVLCHRE